MLFGEDFLSGCRKACMTPEQVGMYIYMLILEWTDKAPLDDDMRRLSSRTGWDTRLVKRLVNELVALDKYQRDNGQLSNERMEYEIGVYVTKLNAKKDRREVDTSRAANRIASQVAVPQLSDSSSTAIKHLSEKANKNNEAETEIGLYARARQIQIQNTEREDKPLYPLSTDHQRVAFENGRLVLFNGLKQQWLKNFGGDEIALDLALTQAAAYVQPASLTRSLEIQVSSQLARMARDKRDKDTRYEKAVKANGKGQKEPELDRLRRLMAPALEREAATTTQAKRLTDER